VEAVDRQHIAEPFIPLEAGEALGELHEHRVDLGRHPQVVDAHVVEYCADPVQVDGIHRSTPQSGVPLGNVDAMAPL
jgi:hypothetical protein